METNIKPILTAPITAIRFLTYSIIAVSFIISVIHNDEAEYEGIYWFYLFLNYIVSVIVIEGIVIKMLKAFSYIECASRIYLKEKNVKLKFGDDDSQKTDSQS